MLNLLSMLHTNSFTPRLYITAATDNMSLQKARLFENSVIDKEFRMAALTCKLSRVSATLLYKILFTAVPSGSNCCYVSTVAFQTDSTFSSCIGSAIFCFGSSFGYFLDHGYNVWAFVYLWNVPKTGLHCAFHPCFCIILAVQ
ncbi:hypothetical protein RHMOL_Rhmol02G0185500 [Rhododendron molle]|uniref:Uncharacterized protein n=1 Tax=Rhododendron molle TaxID=49168 RepID=A0ACC0PT02_RHOML|nr:hypothetical protein RHMOL_Rhmol02G0185500 [Rhododendron molle]